MTTYSDEVRTAVVMKEIKISAAHQLLYHDGKCHREHGHNYTFQVFAKGPINNRSGMVIDFYVMGQHLDEVIGKFDHTNLNPRNKDGKLLTILGGVEGEPDFAETTAENLADAFLYDMQKLWAGYCGIRVWETETCYAQAGHTE